MSTSFERPGQTVTIRPDSGDEFTLLCPWVSNLKSQIEALDSHDDGGLDFLMKAWDDIPEDAVLGAETLFD
jgi:hypothetical protein